MIELAILGLLRDGEMHGYELRKRIGELLGARSGVSFGSLYPALVRLERRGAVKAVEAHDRPTMPLTGSLTGEATAFFARRSDRAPRPARGKKAYGITERGRELLVEMIEDPTTDDRVFALKVAFCRALPPAQRLELFERRRAQLAGQLAGLKTGRRRGGNELLDHYLRSLRERDTASIQHDIDWLDGLIAIERSQAQEEDQP